MKTLENAAMFYEPVPTQIYFLHSCKLSFVQVSLFHLYDNLGFQENYEKLRSNVLGQGIQIEFIKKPTISEADLENMMDPNGGQTLIIIDDNSISAASSKEVAQVFTIARHKNCSIVLLLHFIFGPWPSCRIISANTSYFFLLKSPRMKHQISTLGSQLGKQEELVSAYEQASGQPYGHVLVDLCTNTPEHLRIRSNTILGEENKTMVLQRDDLPRSKCSKLLQTKQPVIVKAVATQTVSPSLKNTWMKLSETAADGSNQKKKHRPRKLPSSDSMNTVDYSNFLNINRRYI